MVHVLLPPMCPIQGQTMTRANSMTVQQPNGRETVLAPGGGGRSAESWPHHTEHLGGRRVIATWSLQRHPFPLPTTGNFRDGLGITA